MKYTFVLYLVFVCKGISEAEGKSGGDETKWPEMKEHYPFIINGTNATLRDVPWFVSFNIMTSPTRVNLCGGAIFNKRTLISAAHCFPAGIKPEDISVRYDSLKDDAGGKTVEVDRIINHPMFGSNPDSKLDYDIAVLTLKTDIELNNDTVKAISLPDSSPKAGTDVLVAGFGLTHAGAGFASSLKMVVLQIFDQAECKKIYGQGVTDRQICTFTPGKNKCTGDSGGPLTLGKTNILVGVVSGGKKCTTAKFPGTYTRVTKFLQFINDNKVE